MLCSLCRLTPNTSDRLVPALPVKLDNETLSEKSKEDLLSTSTPSTAASRRELVNDETNGSKEEVLPEQPPPKYGNFPLVFDPKDEEFIDDIPEKLIEEVPEPKVPMPGDDEKDVNPPEDVSVQPLDEQKKPKSAKKSITIVNQESKSMFPILPTAHDKKPNSQKKGIFGKGGVGSNWGNLSRTLSNNMFVPQGASAPKLQAGAPKHQSSPDASRSLTKITPANEPSILKPIKDSKYRDKALQETMQTPPKTISILKRPSTAERLEAAKSKLMGPPAGSTPDKLEKAMSKLDLSPEEPNTGRPRRQTKLPKKFDDFEIYR